MSNPLVDTILLLLTSRFPPSIGVASPPTLLNLLLNVFQSVEVKYPSVDVVAWDIDKSGVDVPLATDNGAFVVTSVTVPPPPPPAALISMSLPTVLNVMFVPSEIVTSPVKVLNVSTPPPPPPVLPYLINNHSLSSIFFNDAPPH